MIGPASAIVTDSVAAISVGIVEGEERLDLEYVEDRDAEVDMNLVMTGSGRFIEVQGTAEAEPFARPALDQLLALADAGIAQLVAKQKEIVGQILQ